MDRRVNAETGEGMTTTVFERNPKKTLFFSGLFVILIALSILEFTASKIIGLGKVVVYHSHPIYGYRPIPNQTVSRDQGRTTIHINNLGLRANQDWNENQANNTRVLFLGDSVTYGGSYIDNHDLFSTLAFKNNPNLQTANAGVNGWGILNIHGLIKNLNFMPAKVYITVVPEGDFYRGLNRIGGQLFWVDKPKWALEELFYYGVHKLSLQKNRELNIALLPKHEQEKTVALAAQALKEYDVYLKKQGHQHYIFITPTLFQVLQQATNDILVQQKLNHNDLNYIYIKDHIPNNLSIEQRKNLFHDSIHLTQAGHQLWANIIGQAINLK